MNELKSFLKKYKTNKYLIIFATLGSALIPTIYYSFIVNIGDYSLKEIVSGLLIALIAIASIFYLLMSDKKINDSEKELSKERINNTLLKIILEHTNNIYLLKSTNIKNYTQIKHLESYCKNTSPEKQIDKIINSLKDCLNNFININKTNSIDIHLFYKLSNSENWGVFPESSAISQERIDEVISDKKSSIYQTINGIVDSNGEIFYTDIKAAYKHNRYILGKNETEDDLKGSIFLKDLSFIDANKKKQYAIICIHTFNEQICNNENSKEKFRKLILAPFLTMIEVEFDLLYIKRVLKNNSNCIEKNSC